MVVAAMAACASRSTLGTAEDLTRSGSLHLRASLECDGPRDPFAREPGSRRVSPRAERLAGEPCGRLCRATRHLNAGRGTPGGKSVRGRDADVLAAIRRLLEPGALPSDADSRAVALAHEGAVDGCSEGTTDAPDLFVPSAARMAPLRSVQQMRRTAARLPRRRNSRPDVLYTMNNWVVESGMLKVEWNTFHLPPSTLHRWRSA